MPVVRASRVAAASRPKLSSVSLYCLICCLSACCRLGGATCACAAGAAGTDEAGADWACTSGTVPSDRAITARRHATRTRSETTIGNLQQRLHPTIGCLNDTSVVQKL